MTDFCTAAQVKSYLGLTVATDDVLIGSLVSAVSAWIETYLSRNIANATVIETLDGTGTAKMTVQHYPITSLTSVTVDGVAVNSAYLKFRNATIQRTDGYAFPLRSQVALNYTAGYSTIPLDIAQACVEIVAWRYKERDRIGQSSKSAGGAETVAYQTTAIPASAKTILDQYKRRGPL